MRQLTPFSIRGNRPSLTFAVCAGFSPRAQPTPRETPSSTPLRFLALLLRALPLLPSSTNPATIPATNAQKRRINERFFATMGKFVMTDATAALDLANALTIIVFRAVFNADPRFGEIAGVIGIFWRSFGDNFCVAVVEWRLVVNWLCWCALTNIGEGIEECNINISTSNIEAQNACTPCPTLEALGLQNRNL